MPPANTNYFHQAFATVIVLSYIFPGCSPESSFAQTKKNEKWYQQKYCEGKIEVTLPDKTRCDCLTETHAYEFDFAEDWPESIGQALHYARLTNRIPGIYLILKKKEDLRFASKLEKNIKHYDLPIDLILIKE